MSEGELKMLGATDTGRKTTDFIGEISGKSLITYSDLIKRVGLTAGTPHNEDQGWLVFNKDQHPLCISKRTLVYGISYDELDAAGLVDGSLIIQIGDSHYRVRLLTSEEWERYMYPIHEDDPNQQGWGINYTDEDLGLFSEDGRSSWVQDIDPKDPNRRVGRGSSSVEGLIAFTSSYSNAIFGWRVVLESIGSPTEHTPLRSDMEIPIELGEVYKKLKHHHHELDVVLGMAEGPLQDVNVPTLLSELVAECSWLEHHIRMKTVRIEEARNTLLGMREFMQEFNIK